MKLHKQNPMPSVLQNNSILKIPKQLENLNPDFWAPTGLTCVSYLYCCFPGVKMMSKATSKALLGCQN